MRKLILKRILDLKQRDNFTKSIMRWQNFELELEVGKPTHLSEIPFEDEKAMEVLSDEVLLLIFEKIIMRYYKQM